MSEQSLSISLRTWPMLSLREEITDDLEINHLPVQDIFTPTFGNKRLKGTLTSCLEPVPLSLRGTSRPQCVIVDATMPLDEIEVEIDAGSAPCWLACTSFTGKGNQSSFCLFPASRVPLKTFSDITAEIMLTRHDNPTEMLDVILALGYHVLLLDFRRARPPGLHTFTSARAFWRHRNNVAEGPLEIFNLAA